jgi:hypothetical protein
MSFVLTKLAQIKDGIRLQLELAELTKSYDSLQANTSNLSTAFATEIAAHNKDASAHSILVENIYKAIHILSRNTSYDVGDIAYSLDAPSWVMLECVTAGTTDTQDISDYANIQSANGYIVDGTAQFLVHDIKYTGSNNSSGSTGNTGSTTVVAADVFEKDDDGNLMPVLNPQSSTVWTLDDNGDLMPSAS